MEATITKEKVCLEAILEENGIYLYDEDYTPEDAYCYLQISIIANHIERKTEFKRQFKNLFYTSANCEKFKGNIRMVLDSVPVPFLFFASKKMIGYLVEIGCEITADEEFDIELPFLIFNIIQELMEKAEEFKGYEQEN